MATIPSIEYLLNNPIILHELQLLPQLFRAWIGLYLNEETYSYQWLDDTQCRYHTNDNLLCTDLWNDNQPSNIDINHCISIGFDIKTSSFTLITMPCTTPIYFFCNSPKSTTFIPTNIEILTPTNCPRHRMAWHQLTNEQRELYINGFLQLSKMGRLQIFTQTHADLIASGQAHDTSAFLPWHRYFIWEFETQIRNLGSKYECFSLPYWDWSYEVKKYGLNYQMYDILNSGLGGNGDINDNNCINDESLFSKNSEYIPFDCSRTGIDGKCCLQRSVCNNNGIGCDIASIPDLIGNIILWDFYGSDIGGDIVNNYGYREILETEIHVAVHNTMGGFGHLGDSLFAPDDPIFYLLHSFVDYNWALWQDCNDYDLIDKYHINQNIYNGVLNGNRQIGPSLIDDALIFTQLQQQNWSYIFKHPQNCRDMHSISDWYVSYEKGSFWSSAYVDYVCHNINSEWFYDINKNNQEIKRRLILSENDGFAHDIFLRLNKSISNRKLLMRKWKKLNCEYLHLKNDCVRPKYFDDCSDIPFDDKRGDILISLDELIDKVSDYECMIETRIRYYEWALNTKTLYKLCRGDFDKFCDKQFLYDSHIENKCKFV